MAEQDLLQLLSGLLQPQQEAPRTFMQKLAGGLSGAGAGMSDPSSVGRQAAARDAQANQLRQALLLAVLREQFAVGREGRGYDQQKNLQNALIGSQEGIAARGIASQEGRGAQDIIAERALKQTPGAPTMLTPEQAALLRAQAGLAGQRERSAGASTDLAAAIMRMIQRQAGGGAAPGLPAGAGGVPASAPPGAAEAPAPGLEGFLSNLPAGVSLRAGPFTMSGQKTMEEKVQEKGALTKVTEQVKKEEQLKSAETIIETIDQLSTKINTETDPASALVRGAGQKFGAMTGLADIPSVYQDQSQAFLGVLSRSLAAEKGTLTEGDITRIKDGIPKFTDTKQRRDFKIGVMKEITRAAIAGADRTIITALVDKLASGGAARTAEEYLKSLEE